MLEKIKTAPLPVKIAMAILGLFVLVAVYNSPLFTIGAIAFVWAIHTVINYFVDEQFK
jgi:hypothetical protein